jgi:hypothetical protein
MSLRVMAFPDLQSAVDFHEIDCANPTVSHAGG